MGSLINQYLFGCFQSFVHNCSQHFVVDRIANVCASTVNSHPKCYFFCSDFDLVATGDWPVRVHDVSNPKSNGVAKQSETITFDVL